MNRVLIVDDDDDLRLLARLTLEMAGVNVIEATSGDEALRLLRTEPIDVMLLDLNLPALDGWAVLEQVKNDGLLDRVAVIALSAHADSATAERARASGCRGYLRKPYALDALVAAVHGADPAGRDQG